MNFITNANVYNIIKNKAVNNISFDKRVAILTGYNGCGKTTILRCIHETISIYNDGAFANPRKGWAIEVNFKSDFKIRNFCFPFGTKQIDQNDHNYFADNIKIDDKLNDVYEKLFKRLSTDDINKTKGKDHIKLPKDVVATVMNNGILQFPGKDKKNNPCETVLFCDDLFFFNGEESGNKKIKLEELDVFSRTNNLSKTLYMLLQDFSKHSILSDNAKKTQQTILELKSLILRVPEKLREELDSNIKSLEENSEKKELNGFMTDVNVFFNLTKREAFIDEEGLISLKFNGDVVKWYDLSKGEKTLLSLLLVVYLYKDKKATFLFDEPDLSLHIKWQKILIEKLATIAPSSQFIISTHSPALIGGFEDQKIINISGMTRGN